MLLDRIGPIFAKNILNWLAISPWSVNCCWPWINIVGNCSFLCDLDSSTTSDCMLTGR